MVLDNLKDVWKNQKESAINFSESDIYKMIHKKSTSIVKWIFYISVIEFLAVIILPFIFVDSSDVENEIYINTMFINVINILSYVVAAIFIFIFYENYKRISVTDSSHKLMNTIIKTRNTVKYYIITQLSLGVIVLVIFLYKISVSEQFLSNIPDDINKTFLWFSVSLIGFIVLGLVWLFYKLLYGILLNRLRDNYKELRKNE